MNTDALNCNDKIIRYINLQVVWAVSDTGFAERPFESHFFLTGGIPESFRVR